MKQLKALDGNPASSSVNIYLSVKGIIGSIGYLILFLVTASLFGQFYKYFINPIFLSNVIRLFFLDREGNIPSFYSALALLLCGILITIIAIVKRVAKDKSVFHWRVLAVIFLFLSIDEAASIHELLINPVRSAFNTRGFLYFAWVIPAGIFFAFFTLLYMGFVFSLPRRIRNLFLLAASLFVGGSLGIELIGGYWAEKFGFENIHYVMIVTVEETLEMVGILVFIHALLQYLKYYTNIANIRIHLQE